MFNVTGEAPIYLSTLPAGCSERRFTFAVVLASVVIFLAAAPFAKLPLVKVPAFIPIYESALVINDLVTAVLLFGQFRILRARALLLLASGYLFTACMAVAHALTFPGLFAPAGLLGAGPQSTAWLYMFWHGGFPLFVIAYTRLKNAAPEKAVLHSHIGLATAAGIVSALAIVWAFTLTATSGQDALPAIMQGNRYTPAMIFVVSSVWGLSLIALLVLWRQPRPHSVLDLWLMVVMCAWLFDIALAAVLNAGRFDLGFYAGRIYGLLASGFVLTVLLLENGKLYAKLVETHEMERRQTEDLRRLSVELERRAEERRIAIDALHHKEEQIRAVMDNLLDCILTIDVKGIVRSANPALAHVLGYAPEEVIGRHISMLMPEPHRSGHDGYLEHYLRTGKARVIGIGCEVEGLHKDGRLIPLELTVNEYTVCDEHLFIGTLRDIRERKRFVAELTQARADAEQASRAKSAFLATMSHEIRTPMNGVIGMVEVLTRSRLTEHQAELVRTIRESASALLGIIDDILDFSKIEAGRLEIEQAPLSVADLVEGIGNSLLPVAARKGVDLSLFITPDLPEQVLADDVRLRQVLYNLIGNAIKFSAGRPDQRGQVSIRIDVAQATPLRVAVTITDNGIGMAPETLDHLFTPFTQAEVSTTRRFGGTGLGLAICKRLVELMDGEITVASKPGHGSTFTLTLPFEVAAAQPVHALPDVSGLNCIVVDNPDLQTSAVHIYLEHAGARVQLAADAAAAARMVASQAAPVVVIQDAGRARPVIDAAFAAVPHARHLFIIRGRRRRLRMEAADMVTLDGDLLRRQALLRAVAVAAGRASPEIPHDGTAENMAGEQVSPPTVADARKQGRLILIAEDDDINQKVILQQLALLGYAAQVADSGVEALRLWRAGDYALLLTDLHMPEMDGYTLAETIRREEADRRRMPILALTANALRGEANRALAAGMDEYLTKPVQLQRLRDALEKWLPRSEASPQPAALPEQTRSWQAATALELAVLKGLVGDDDKIVREFLADYQASARRLAAQLRTACTAEELLQVGAIAHKLKSASRSVGALAMGELCAGLESAGRAGNKAAVAQDLHEFEAALAAVEAAIANVLAQQAE